MDAKLSRSNIVKEADPHDWNSYDHYHTIHEKRIGEHPLVDEDRPNTLNFEFIEFEGDLFASQQGDVYCKRGIVLEVGKLFETRIKARRLQVRGFSYRYVAFVDGGHPILRYHNLHENPDDYIHRVFNPQTGDEILYEILKREQFPLFTEVLDEIDYLTCDLSIEQAG